MIRVSFVELPLAVAMTVTVTFLLINREGYHAANNVIDAKKGD